MVLEAYGSQRAQIRQPATVNREVQILHLKDPRAVSPGSLMPSYAHLSDEELNALVDYLLTLK